MVPQKAQIKILDKAAINPSIGLHPVIDVQFNPTEYTLNKGAQIAEIAIYGIDSPILQFVRGQNEKLTLDLFFDTTRPEGTASEAKMGDGAIDVRDKTKSIYQLVKIQSATHAPPRVQFVWGSLAFKAIVESVSQKFTLFNPSGIPLRATLSVTFREYKTLKEQLSELKLQSSDHTKQWKVKEGDSLSLIANEEYDDPTLWRFIAEHKDNQQIISNPRRLSVGTVLTIPPLGVFSEQVDE
jgi:hypothetical protein